ncbi:MAG: hypothetical protein JXO22_06175 [Phycisphaerae bacterium]|nr:hypothetical protein [Phycisphaerae bacterium]
MAHDHFAILGLRPGLHKPAEVRRRFEDERQRLVAALHDPARHHETRQQLEELHIAYRTLSDQERQRRYLDAADRTPAPAARLRRLIAVSLEDGLLRQSRREVIIEQGRALGFSEFQVQLMIAQEQFGDKEVDAPVPRPRRQSATAIAVKSRLVAAAALAAGMFLLMVRWLGV